VVAVAFYSSFENIVKSSAEFSSMRDYLATRFWWNNSQNYLWYPVELTPQSNNDTMASRLINNMSFPDIWLAQKNITDIKR
jgi:hypothetical protein